MTQEALSSLKALGEQLRARLLELPEYRALMVIDRTIQEISQIFDEPVTALKIQPAPAPAPEEARAAPAVKIVAAPPRPEPAPPAPFSSQSRMATAIAEAIAARSTAFDPPQAAAPRPVFSVAS